MAAIFNYFSCKGDAWNCRCLRVTIRVGFCWEVEWKTQDSDETDLLCWGAPGLNLGNGEFDVDIMEENV